MTASTDPSRSGGVPGVGVGRDPGVGAFARPTLDAGWRARAAAEQEAAMPSGRVVVSCPAPLGAGGLGRHLQEIVQALDRGGQPREVVCQPREEALGGRALTAALAPGARLSPAWRLWSTSVRFDADAARSLPAADHLIGFNGTSLAQFKRLRSVRPGAAARSSTSLSLMSANSHFRHLIARHELAHRQYPIERPWPTHLLRRNLLEYGLAERIYVASRYVRESFLAEGFAPERLELFPLTPDPRFSGERPSTAATFDVVYVGGLTVHKGVPLLIDAVRRLPHRDLRLVLVGGPKSRPMRRFLERVCREDERIVLRPGDPLPRLRSARLCVHAAYEDGFAYAPAEAMACGLPVIVSEDTGMKDLVDEGRSGLVLATGDRAALTEAIDAAYRREIFGG